MLDYKQKLRGYTSITGAVEIVEELEEPQQPPAVIQNIIVPDYIVASFSTIERQLSREGWHMVWGVLQCSTRIL